MNAFFAQQNPMILKDVDKSEFTVVFIPVKNVGRDDLIPPFFFHQLKGLFRGFDREDFPF